MHWLSARVVTNNVRVLRICVKPSELIKVARSKFVRKKVLLEVGLRIGEKNQS